MTRFLTTGRAPAVPPSGAGPSLVLTRDPALVADVQRLAAAAGAEVELHSQPGPARALWLTAPVVLVGPDLVEELQATGPPRRGHVHVVARAPVVDATFRDALAVGAESVVELPAADAWLVEILTDTADGAARHGTVVGVVGGCGGAGATTFATALAAAAAADGQPVTLVDLDRLGSGVEHVAGVEPFSASGWGALGQSSGRLGSRSLRASLPGRGGLVVLGWGAAPRQTLDPMVAREALSAAQRGSALVVVDVPRYADAATIEALVRADHLVLVTPLTASAVAAAARVAAEVLPLTPTAHLVTRGARTALDPDDVAAALGLPLAASMTGQRRLAESVELGLGPLVGRRGPLARAARATLRTVVP